MSEERCRCHNRTGLEMRQHENDCPLAQPVRWQGPVLPDGIWDEAARIPDRIFMDSPAQVKSPEPPELPEIWQVREELRQLDGLADKIRQFCHTMGKLHGHGPPEVTWTTDFDQGTTRAVVSMAYSEDCSVCRILKGAVSPDGE